MDIAKRKVDSQEAINSEMVFSKQGFYRILPKSTILIGTDHAGFEYKEVLKKYLSEKKFTIEDVGTFSSESCDYPDFANLLAYKIDNKKASFGILICGSGNGVCMVANKYRNVRAALCWNEEIATLARAHNDANILCLPARFISIGKCQKIVDIFFSTMFERGRYQRRVEKF
ncbi:MAG: ribose 5-phosphate isomerase B [Chitinophagaceae bacterium]